MRHEPPHTFKIESDEADNDLIKLCAAARRALRHEGKICGCADDLLFTVAKDMPPVEYGPGLFWLRAGISASELRNDMREMRRQEGGYNKATYAAYAELLPRLTEREAQRNAEFIRRGGQRLRRREAASRRRYEGLMEKVCGTPARTPIGLSHKCSVIPAWIEAGFGLSEDTPLMVSIIQDQQSLRCGLPPRVKSTDHTLIPLAIRVGRQIKRNQASWHRLSVLEDKQTSHMAGGLACPDLAREIHLAASRARHADKVTDRHLRALADWPCLSGDEYIAKHSVYTAFQQFGVKSSAASALYVSLRRDFAILKERHKLACQTASARKAAE